MRVKYLFYDENICTYIHTDRWNIVMVTYGLADGYWGPLLHWEEIRKDGA